MSNFHRFSPDAMSPGAFYRLMIGAIVPRPIALVSTRRPDGALNLAPFSFFMGVSSSPPCLAFSITPQADGTKKDTLLNIESTQEFVVNSAQADRASQINQASGAYAYGVSEFEKAGWTPIASELVAPPRVQECSIQMECRLEKLVPIGEGGLGSAVIVVGRIVRLHADPKVLDSQGGIDIHALKPIARLGGRQWGEVGNVFELDRPKA